MARMSRPYAKLGERWRQFPTYTRLKSEIKKLIDESPNGEVFVTRSRRGEWGEWFEYWSMSNGQPVITKQGWI